MATLGTPVVLFGGEPQLFDTWIFDGARWNATAGPGPSGRDNHAMATLGDNVVLYGGAAVAKEYANDTWVFDGVSWGQQQTRPVGDATTHHAFTGGAHVPRRRGGALVR